MKDNFDNKPLEEFFRNHLDPLEGEPGADFWEELEPLIPPPPKKRRRLLLWWWGLGLVVLGLALGGYLWQKGSRINRLSEKLTQQQLQIDALVEEKEMKKQGENHSETEAPSGVVTEHQEAKNERTSKGLDRKEKQADFNTLRKPGKQSTTTKITKATKTKTKTNATSFTAESIKTVADLLPASAPTLVADSTAIPMEVKVMEEEKTTEERSPLFLFDELERLLTPVELMPDRIWIRTFDSLDIVEEFQPLFDIGVFYEQSVLARLRNPEDRSYLFADNFSFQGRDLGIEIGLRLGKKWRLSTGIGWAKMILDTETTGRVNFSKVDATFEEGWIYNNYDYSVSTALGTTNYSAEVGFLYRDNPNVDPEEGEWISFRFSERDELDYLHLPLHLGYQFGKGKWTWNAGLGLDYYYLLKADAYSREAEQITTDGFVTLRNIRASNESRLVGLRNSLWGARASLGLSFRPAKKWQFNLSAAYQYGLSGITAQTEGQVIIFKTNLDLLQLRLGVFYEF